MSGEDLVRVGDGIYKGSKLIAAWIRGAWYRPIREKGVLVWNHINPAMSEAESGLIKDCEGAVRSEY